MKYGRIFQFPNGSLEENLPIMKNARRKKIQQVSTGLQSKQSPNPKRVATKKHNQLTLTEFFGTDPNHEEVWESDITASGDE